MALVSSGWLDPEDAVGRAYQMRPTAKASLAHDPVSAAHGVVGRNGGHWSVLTRSEEIELAARGRDTLGTEPGRKPR